MTTPFLSSDRHFTPQSAATRLATPEFAVAKAHSADSRSQPEPSGLTRGELRQIVLDILG